MAADTVKQNGGRKHFAARGGELVHLVFMVHLVDLVYLVEGRNKPDKPNKLDRPLRFSDIGSRDFDSPPSPRLKKIGGGRFLYKDFKSAIAVDERGRLFCRLFAVTGDKPFDDPLADPNERLPARCGNAHLFKMLLGQVGNQIAESINVDDLTHQGQGFPFRLRGREGLAVVDESPEGRERLLCSQPGRSQGEEIAAVEGVA